VLDAEFSQEGSAADTPRARGGPGARVGDDRLPYPERIKDYERKLEALAQEHYPETKLLRQVRGVGTLTALAFVLTLEDPKRFRKSRGVGAYLLGLAPAKNQSGERDLQQRISKEGDEMLRRLLLGSAHYILGPFGEDSDLRRHVEKIAQHGGKSAKKRAVVVAVARKLSVLLHHLWISGEAYEPLYNARHPEEGGQVA
jgi:transposase